MALVKDKPEDVTPADPDTLADIPATGAVALTLPTIDATFVKFTGTSGELLDNPPEQDVERTYIVKAKCSGYDIRTRADGERRVVAIMDITSCYERGRVPIVDESQPSLYAVDYTEEEQQTVDDMVAANAEPDPETEQ